jgi:molybdenum cofactor guanylyltransferase
VQFSAALLAGGKSSRMGRDKAALVIDGLPLWQRQFAVLRELEPTEIFISGEIPNASCIADDTPGLGPLGGITTILRRITTPWLLVLAVDMPAMTSDFLRTLVAEARDGRGIIPTLDDYPEPLAALYPRAALALAESQLARGERRMETFARDLAAAGLVHLRAIAKNEHPLFQNWNTPEDVTK